MNKSKKEVVIGHTTKDIKAGEILKVSFIGNEVSCESIKLTQEGSDYLKVMRDDKFKRCGFGMFI